MAVSRDIPTVAGERRMRLAKVEAARKSVRHGPTWSALYVKAFAIVARNRPELRRAYMPFPTPHLFEAAENLASVSVARDFHGEPAVFFGTIRSPENRTLVDIASMLNSWRTEPVESVPTFRRLLKYSRYPQPIRRFIWRLAMNLSGRHRVKTFGTFGVTAIAAGATHLLNIRAPTAFNLAFGRVDNDGCARVLFSLDHRVIDGMAAIRTLNDLEAVLNGPILQELKALDSWSEPLDAAA